MNGPTSSVVAALGELVVVLLDPREQAVVTRHAATLAGCYVPIQCISQRLPERHMGGHIHGVQRVCTYDRRTGEWDEMTHEADDSAWLAARFEEHRGRMRGIAYRVLGSATEADDAVREAWLRLSRTDAGRSTTLRPGSPRSSAASRSTCCARAGPVARSRWTSRGTYRSDSGRALTSEEGSDPEQEAILADSVGVALVVSAALSPAERLAFVLHDIRPALRRDRADRRSVRLGCQAARVPGAAAGTRD